MIHCVQCGYEGPRGVVVFNNCGEPREYCQVCRPSNNVTPAKNPYQNFTLQHVRGRDGKPITINSQAELRRVEKEHNVALAVASDDGGRADKPPRHEPGAGDITRDYKRKFNRDPAAYKNPGGVSAGVAASANKTLASAPNPINH